MAKFNYSMENILRIKERIEEQKRMDLGKAMVDYQKSLDLEQVAEVKLTAYLEAFYGEQRKKVNASTLQQMSRQVAWYEESLQSLKKMTSKALEVVEVKREALKKALEEKKIQEKLKERAFEQYQEEEKIKEQQILDEIVGYRYASGDRND